MAQFYNTKKVTYDFLSPGVSKKLEKNGVLRNVDQSDSIIEKINLKTYLELKKEQIISDGMIPKLDNCFHALKNKVLKVNIGTIDMITNSQKKHTSLHLS